MTRDQSGPEPEQIRHRGGVEDTGYNVIYHVLTFDPRLSDGAFRLYVVLLHYARQTDRAWPGIARLALDLSTSEGTIKRRLAELEELGLVTRARRFMRSSVTWLEDLREVYEGIKTDPIEQVCEQIKSDPTIQITGDPTENLKEISEQGGIQDVLPDPPGPEPVKAEPSPAASAWRGVMDGLQLEMTRATFDRYVRGLELLSLQDGQAVIACRDPMAADWLAHRLRAQVERAISRAVGRPVLAAFVLRKEATK